MNYVANTGNIPHIFSARPNFNHKSRFFLNYLVILGRYSFLVIFLEDTELISMVKIKYFCLGRERNI